MNFERQFELLILYLQPNINHHLKDLFLTRPGARNGVDSDDELERTQSFPHTF